MDRVKRATLSRALQMGGQQKLRVLEGEVIPPVILEQGREEPLGPHCRPGLPLRAVMLETAGCH